MRDVLPTLDQWASEGRRFATATVTRTWGSSPRPIGSVMGIREDGFVVGSVSGGCVEGAVIEAALQALHDGQSRELTFSGITDETAWEVGLSCGGSIQVWIDPLPVEREPCQWAEIVENIRSDRPFVILTELEPYSRTLWQPGLPAPHAVQEAYRDRASREVELEGRRLFLQVLPSRERLLIVGAVHIAMPLIKFAKELGFETVVIDPRGSFAQPERFETVPDRLIAAWPEQALSAMKLTVETYAVVLTHDPKIDDAALTILLKSPVAYIGALGSRTTQAKRRTELAALGFSEEDLARIHGPVGLAISARSPQEIALSIMAEIVQVRNAPRPQPR